MAFCKRIFAKQYIYSMKILPLCLLKTNESTLNRSKRQRICFLNSSGIWGGGEKWHLETSIKLRERGFETMVFSNPGGLLYKKSQNEGIPVVPLRIKNLSFLNPLKALYLFLQFRRMKPQTVIVGLTSDLKASAPAARLAGVKRIIYRRGTALPLKNNLINHWLYQHLTDAIIVNSREIKSLLLSHNSGFIEESKIHLIYNEVEMSAYRAGNRNKGLHTGSNGEVVLGNIGRLVEQKGQKHLIELAHHLKQQGISFRILIAGSGKLKDQLMHYARQLGVEDKVQFMDFIDDIQAFIHNIDIFVFPSLHEGSSHTLLEVMAASKPVVAFNISSIPEIVEHNKNGFLVERDNSEDLFRCVHKLIAHKDLRSEFGARGREKVEKEFNSDQSFNRLLRLLGAEK